MTDAKPYSKSQQLARPQPRYRRKVAGPKTWQRLWDEKGGPCRICSARAPLIELHHVVTREDHGDDAADNLVPLCADCHRGVHLREPAHCRLLLSRLSDAEYAHMVEAGGEDYAERVYGIEYAR